MVHTKDEFHGFTYYAKFITLTNQCVHCLSTFKTRETAQAHTANAEKTGACRTSRSKYDLQVIPIAMMTCVLCGKRCTDHLDMQAHLAQHSLHPPRAFNVPCHRYELKHSREPKRQTTAKLRPQKPAQARKRSRHRSPQRRAQLGERHARSSTHRSTKSTTAIPAPIYEIGSK